MADFVLKLSRVCYYIHDNLLERSENVVDTALFFGCYCSDLNEFLLLPWPMTKCFRAMQNA